MDLTEAALMGRRLLDQHGLHDWTIVFDRAKRRAGICRWARKEIGLSAPLTSIHPESEVRDTVLHEVAHALVGPRHGHDQVWRALAMRIGCSGERCSSDDAPGIDGHWVGTCPAGHLLTWTFRGQPAQMLPGYRAELERLTAAAATPAPKAPVRLGDPVRIVVPGSKYDGVTGTLVKRGRTRYHLRVGNSVMTVPFAMVQPA